MSERTRTSISERLAQQMSQVAIGGVAGAGALDEASDAGCEDNVLRNLAPAQHLARIAVDLVSPAPEGQARQDFNDERLQALADSLKRSGIREPIIVTPHGAEPGRYQIVAGERRWRAAKLAGLAEVPCLVDPHLVHRKDKLLAQAEENLHRENLNAVEEAMVLAQLMESRGVDVLEAGELMGKSAMQARRLYRIHLAVDPIKSAVARGQLDARAAVEVIRIYNKVAREDASEGKLAALKTIEVLIDRIVTEGWSIRRIEQYALEIDARGESVSEDAGEKAEGAAAKRARKVRAPPAPGTPAAAAPVPTAGPEPIPLVEHGDGRIVLDAARIARGDISPEEREHLIAVLEELLMQVRRA
jgi:ParB family transcriptional regulator, chromosome partitioning protein